MAKFETPGRAQLRSLNLGSSEISRRFGEEDGKPVVNQSTVSRWLAGDSRPDTRSSTMIEALFAIPGSAWLTLDEQEQQRRALAKPEPKPSDSGEMPLVNEAATGTDGEKA
jgi:hypothetical protein